MAIGRPPGKERIGGQDAPAVAPAAHDGGGGGDADFAVARLEDLVGPGHRDGHGGAEAEADQEETGVAGPGVGDEGCHQEAGDLDADGDGEEEGAVVVEAVGDRGDEEDGDEIALGVKVHVSVSGGFVRIAKEVGKLTIQIGAVRRERSILLKFLLIPWMMTEA